MTKPYKLPSFTVVVDTNAIYPKDMSNLVGTKFIGTWKACTAITQLNLIIPEVVKGERLYQLTAVARQSIESATKNLERLVRVTGCDAPKAPELEIVKKAIENKFDAWVKECDAKIAPVPYSKIDWPRIVADAIWRVNPFEAPTEEKDSEKGFRDCLILETLTELVHTTVEQVVFISKDSLLRGTAVGKFKIKEFAAYEDLPAFLSYLNLAKEKTNKEYAQAVFQKVPQVFFAPNDPNCVYNKFRVGERIFKQFSGLLNVLFNKPQASPGVLTGLIGFGPGDAYMPASVDKIFIDSTEFIHDPKTVGVKWKTRVRLVRLFRNQASSIPGLEWLNETIRIQPFDVIWTADIDSEMNFTNLNLANIGPGEQTTEVSFMNAAKYGLNAPPPQSPQ